MKLKLIEVLSGGGFTLYGSDAIGGIINIVTSRATIDLQQQPQSQNVKIEL